MMVLSEADIGIPCDSAKCTAQAMYVLVVKIKPRYVRMYCPQCTAAFLQGAVKSLRDGESLHDYVETEHLVKGYVIDA
jgi:RNase P subunit RPR2